MLSQILLVFAFVLCFIHAVWFGPWPKPHLGWLSLALFFLSLILDGISAGHFLLGRMSMIIYPLSRLIS